MCLNGHWMSLVQAWDKLHLPPVQYIAAESDPFKRDILLKRSLWPEIMHLYSNVHELPGLAWDFKQKQFTQVDSVDILLMGFPCKDLSVLKENPHPFCPDSESVSFDAFSSLDKILPDWQPELVILENVKGPMCCVGVSNGVVYLIAWYCMILYVDKKWQYVYSGLKFCTHMFVCVRCSDLNIFEYIWIYLNLFEYIWIYL